MSAKKYFLPIIILAFLVALFPLARRWRGEKENTSAHLVYDGHGLLRLAANLGASLEEVIDTLGVDSVTLQVLTPKMLTERNAMTIKPLKFSSQRNLRPFAPLEGPKDKIIAYEVSLENPYIREFFLDNLPASYRFFPVPQEENHYIVLKFKGLGEKTLYEQDLMLQPLDFYPYDLDAFLASGVNVVLRPALGQGKDSLELKEILKGDLPFKEVIFAGGQVWGYPDELEETAELFRQGNITWGFIEPFLANQKGARELGSLLPGQVSRVHSIQQREINILPSARVVSRYLRAVEERNARFLYLRPSFRGGNALEKMANNKLILDQLKEGLEARGYQIGPPGLYKEFSLKFVELLILYLGLLAAACLFFNYYWPFKFPIDLFILLGGLLFALFTLFIGHGDLLVKLSQLALAILAPLLPLLLLLKASKWPKFGWPLVTGGTILAGLYLAAFASDRLFVLGLDYFRGVKFTLLIPLGLLAFFIYREKLASSQSFPKDLGALIRLVFKPSVLVTGIFLVLVALLYVTRSGNHPILPVPAWEINLRENLEGLFLLRPRFKEVFWGHPLLILGLYLWRKEKYPWTSGLLVTLGSIGQITIVNSFTHFHTPIWVSLWRSGVGAVLGGFLGYGLVFLIEGFLKISRKGLR